MLPWRAQSINVQSVQIPHLDLTSLGRIAFTGDFEALSLYEYTQQSNSPLSLSNNGAQSVLQQLPNGDFINLGNADGTIEHVGEFVMQDGTNAGIIVVGNFTSIGGVEAQGIALFEPSNGSFIPLPGIDGTISAMLVDSDTSTFYVGGSFKGASSSNTVAWANLSGWIDVPFEGFNGPVNSIAKLWDGSLAFGGSFTKLGNPNYAANTSGSLQGNATELNGLFGFNPTAPSNSASSVVFTHIRLDAGAVVNDLLSYNDSLFIAGAFLAEGIHNILAVENYTFTALSGGGLNNVVNTLYITQDLLYAGGNFTDTANITTGNLSNVAVYSILGQHWQALGAGVNGPVWNLNPLLVNITPGAPPETVIVVNGEFNQLQDFDNNSVVSVDGLGVWVPSAKNWLQNLPIEQQAFYGQLSGCTNTSIAQESELICVGTLSSYGLRASNAVGFYFRQSSIDLSSLGLNIKSTNGSGAVTGLFYLDEGLNLTAIAGQFEAEASDGSIVRNLAFINSSSNTEVISGISSDFGSNSIIQSVATISNIIYAGGVLAGKAGSQDVNGIFAYDLSAHDYSVSQPPALEGNNVEVKAMEVRPDTNQLYIGGNFEKAGSIDCRSVCAYDVALLKWIRPGTGLSGSVTYLTWTDSGTLIAAGNISINGKPYSLATLFVSDGMWAPFRQDQPIPGQITAMSPTNAGGSTSDSVGTSDAAGFWIAGIYPNNSAFLTKWDNGTWLPVDQDFGSPSRITGVDVMALDQATAPNDYLEDGLILILTGRLSLSPTGNASAAFFNGTDLWPMVLTIGADGNPGLLSQMFSEKKTYFVVHSDPRGFVVAIASTVIAFLVSIITVGELSEIIRRHWLERKGYGPVSQNGKS